MSEPGIFTNLSWRFVLCDWSFHSELSQPESLRPLLEICPLLTDLKIRQRPKLKCLPFSVGRLNLLEHLTISGCPISQVEFGAVLLPFALSNLKWIHLEETEVCRISNSEDRYSRLQGLSLHNNHHLTEIEASIRLTSCKMLKNIRAICDLVNLEWLDIVSCPKLDELPSFARFTSLRGFELSGCDQIKKTEGLEYCRTLESLKVHTYWQVLCIESLEHMEKLRMLELRAHMGSAIYRCIQMIQKWPEEKIICTDAVFDAASLVKSFLSPSHVVVVDSSNQKLQFKPKLVQKGSSNGHVIMLCFVINCVSSQMILSLVLDDGFAMSEMEM